MEPVYTLNLAVREANRCLLCYDAPCSSGCPAGTDPALFIRKLRLRNIKGAINVIKENNIFGGVCGVLCPTKRLCEEKCTATEIDVPVNIGKIQRFLIEYGWSIDFNPLEKPEPVKGKIAVIGAGPSGLACGAELARNGFGVVVFEKREKPGGVLEYLLPSYRLPGTLLEREIEDIKRLGVEIKCNSPVEGKDDIKKLLDGGFRAVYIATGLWKPVRLGIPNQDLEGIYASDEFLEKAKEFQGKIKDKDVVVVGGGDAAMDVAETAKRNGSREVYLVYRRSFNQMPADIKRKESVLASGVHFLFLLQPEEYIGEKGRVSGVKLVRNKLGDMDETRRARPVAIPGSGHTITADIVIEAIGFEPAEPNERLCSNLERSNGELVSVDEKTGRTSMKNVYAGGDIVRGPSLVVNAVADGKRAAREIIATLS